MVSICRDKTTTVFCRLGMLGLLLLLPVVPGQSLAQSAFDHFTTGFRLDGAHRFAECEACHTDGLFAGTPIQCSGCHTQAGRIIATSKPAFHVTTTNRCDSCHAPSAWVAVSRVDHLEVLGTCASCHNSFNANGKPVNHVPASEQCDDCHRSTAWVPAAFDHAGIAGACFSCHNGTIASGKIVNHIPATNLCEDCHNTIMWNPVSRVDHLQVLGTCSTCHNGVTATGQPPQHIPTILECDNCHNTIAWR